MGEEKEPFSSDIILYSSPSGQTRIEVWYQDESFWLTQKRMAELFGVEVNTINYHLKEIFKAGELAEAATIRKVRIVQMEGTRSVARETDLFHLDAIIAVGYRVNSHQATQFRIWATQTLRDKQAELTQTFFKTVQDKLHWAVTGKTAAELIASRASADKPNMGLMTWKNAPAGKIMASDSMMAKNYLIEKEIKDLERVVSIYLDYAENQAARQSPMKMEDWIRKLDGFLQFNEYEILTHAGKVSHEVAKSLAEAQYARFRVEQDRLFESDFEKETKRLGKRKPGGNPGKGE